MAFLTCDQRKCYVTTKEVHCKDENFLNFKESSEDQFHNIYIIQIYFDFDKQKVKIKNMYIKHVKIMYSQNMF